MEKVGYINFNVILSIIGISIPSLPSQVTKALNSYGLCKKELPTPLLLVVILFISITVWGDMNRIKDQVLREFGDQGAETLGRYIAQIEYTALWCIRLLDEEERIFAVIPEGVEDVVIVREMYSELHQVKTRSESQGAWTLSDVLPILCQQYHRRNAFTPSQCQYHFVSNGLAENKRGKPSKSNPSFSLYQLKHLLEIKQSGQVLNAKETEAFLAIEKYLIPEIQEGLREKHNEINISETEVKDCVGKTWIETASLDLKGGLVLEELQNILMKSQQDGPSYTTYQLRNILDRILLLVIKKIINTTSLEERKIIKEDVLQCKVSPTVLGSIDLDKVPGQSILDKKAYLGGFDLTETPIFNRQRKQADWTWRRLETIGLNQELERLTTSLLDLQGTCRNSICRIQGIKSKPGPQILNQLRPQLTSLASKIVPNQPDIDEQFCLGIIWNQTDLCSAWWHGFDENGLLENESKH